MDLLTGFALVVSFFFYPTFSNIASPTSANLIYTAQPLFTSLFAFFLLGETMGAAGLVGGTLIASAVYTVASIDGEGSTGANPDHESVTTYESIDESTSATTIPSEIEDIVMADTRK